MATVSARQVVPEQISRNSILELLPTKVPYGGEQGSATSGLMPIVRDGNPVNDVVWVSFGNGAVVMSFDWATAYISNASDWNAINRKMICAGTLDLAAVRCGVAKTNHISHGLTFCLRRGLVVSTFFGCVATSVFGSNVIRRTLCDCLRLLDRVDVNWCIVIAE